MLLNSVYLSKRLKADRPVAAVVDGKLPVTVKRLNVPQQLQSVGQCPQAPPLTPSSIINS